MHQLPSLKLVIKGVQTENVEVFMESIDYYRSFTMQMWEQRIIRTDRGSIEVFIKGEGSPVCVTHHYSAFNHTGDYYADIFTDKNKVVLVNLKDAGNSDKPNHAYELSMIDAVLDLEEVRKKLGYKEWIYAGHSTGGMMVFYMESIIQLP